MIAPNSQNRKQSSRLKTTKLSLVDVALNQVKDIDPDIKQFLESLDFSLPTSIDFQRWNLETAQMVYQIAPMTLIQRKDGYEVLGSGRAWRLAQAVYSSSDSVPAFVLTDTKRISASTKMQFLAAELFGLFADYRTRPNLPAALKRIWDQLNAQEIETIEGTQARDFAKGTGFNIKSLSAKVKPPPPPKQA